MADPPEANVLALVGVIREHEASGVLTIGGGSPMDVAKVAALIAGGGEQLSEAYGVNKARGPRLPLALVPTTAGTGSEVTPVAIITTGEAMKAGVVSPLLLPDIAGLDAELPAGLPPAVTAATGIDAMVHATESYASTSANNNPISQGLARQVLRLLEGGVKGGSASPGSRPLSRRLRHQAPRRSRCPGPAGALRARPRSAE